LRASPYWPLDLDAVRNVLTDLSMKVRTNGTGWDASRPGARPVAPPPPVDTPGLVLTREVFRTIDGNRWVPCPLCRLNVLVPPLATGEVALTCTGCRRAFVADLRRMGSASAMPPPPRRPPPPTLWKKVCQWFGC
jgi:hypothetical protein